MPFKLKKLTNEAINLSTCVNPGYYQETSAGDCYCSFPICAFI